MALGQADLIDYYMQLERRIARLERTSTVANNQGDTAFVNALTITGLSIASQTVVAYGTDHQVYVNMGWSAPTFDSDVITDDELIGYYTSFTKNGTNYTAEAFTNTTDATIGPLAQGQSITFAVRAVTQKGTLGPYATSTFSTTLDNVAPAQPSTPTASPYLGQLRVFWDGLTVSATAMPEDLVACEIHISTSSITFTPDPSTLVDVFYPGGGYYTITDLVYGTTYYVRLVAVDKVGNRSPSSTGTSAVPVQAADGDIASLSIGKLVAGNLYADMIVSARIKTADSGARVEFNPSGFQAYSPSGVQTVNISGSTGLGTFTGAVQTGTSSYRIIMDASGFGFPTIAFMPSSGSNYAYINAAGDLLGCNSQTGTHSGNSVYTRLMLGAQEAELSSLKADQSDYGGYIGVGVYGVTITALSGESISICSDGDIDVSGTFPTTGNAANVYNQAGGSLARSTSSRTVKTLIEDVTDVDALMEGLNKLRPVTFYDKKDYSDVDGDTSKLNQQLGLIAEEVREIGGPISNLMYTRYTDRKGSELAPGIPYERLAVLLLLDRKRIWSAIEELKST